jgi:hypothetical protein
MISHKVVAALFIMPIARFKVSAKYLGLRKL